VPDALRHPDMRDKKRITIHVTQQFAKDLNLVMASYDLSNVSHVVQQSVAAQANAIRDQVAEGVT
jgi:hypothetical protein